MTDVARMLDQIAKSGPGKVFLVNLHDTLRFGQVDAEDLKSICREEAAKVPDVIAPEQCTKIANGLVTSIGMRCVKQGIWRQSSEPALEESAEFGMVLSRFTTYHSFFTAILRRPLGSQHDILPDPLLVKYGHDEDMTSAEPDKNVSEIDPDRLDAVAAYINDGEWKKPIERYHLGLVHFSSDCVWVAPRSELEKRASNTAVRQADFYRDIVGLNHLRPGHHLIRLDVNLKEWDLGLKIPRRRPHGACNGGDRFRMLYDGPRCFADWGRTVNLAVLAGRESGILDGVPEMIMEPFKVPVEKVTASYIGAVQTSNDKDHDRFYDRISQKPITEIIRALAERLS